MFLKIIIFLFFLISSFKLLALDDRVIIASTTSTYDSGLISYINEFFEDLFDIKIHVLSLGTGQAIRVAQDGNAEILLVHHTSSELKFMNDGYGLIRHKLMYNDYVLVGPKKNQSDCQSVEIKLREIIHNNSPFISRGDDSGTHKKELELWNSINFLPDTSFWYQEVGQGMGNTLLIANEKSAYTLSDRGTWVSFNKKENLSIVCENLPPLFNQYGLIIVDPIVNSNLDIEKAKIYVNWLISDSGKELINNFRNNGQQLFYFNHH
ncbi:substrate-binding domain-containing protein [Alphaproteobacteria bacterium]|nr:substrate-binding domain-containing protein [Alphaproteobacteria bacterium]